MCQVALDRPLDLRPDLGHLHLCAHRQGPLQLSNLHLYRVQRRTGVGSGLSRRHHLPHGQGQHGQGGGHLERVSVGLGS